MNWHTSLLTHLQEPMLYIKGLIVFLLGPVDIQMSYLVAVILVDLWFGVQVARKEKTFTWGLLGSKLANKIFGYSLWIIMFHAFDMVAGLPDTSRWALITMLVGLEILSSIKNTAKLGHVKLAMHLETLYMAMVRPKMPEGLLEEQKQADQEGQPQPTVATPTNEGEVTEKDVNKHETP